MRHIVAVPFFEIQFPGTKPGVAASGNQEALTLLRFRAYKMSASCETRASATLAVAPRAAGPSRLRKRPANLWRLFMSGRKLRYVGLALGLFLFLGLASPAVEAAPRARAAATARVGSLEW